MISASPIQKLLDLRCESLDIVDIFCYLLFSITIRIYKFFRGYKKTFLIILSDNEESLMPLRTMLWRFFTSFKNDIFSPFYETINFEISDN